MKKKKFKAVAHKFSKDEIISEVEEGECPMMQDLHLETISKNKLIEHLADACCPILARLVEGKTDHKK